MSLYKDYEIITGEFETALQRQVCERMADGWVPLGGLVISERGLASTWAQAMVKPKTLRSTLSQEVE